MAVDNLGGHWNVAVGLVTRSSSGLGLPDCVLGSGDGLAKGALLVMDTQQKSGVAVVLATPPGGTDERWGEGLISSSASSAIRNMIHSFISEICSKAHSIEITTRNI